MNLAEKDKILMELKYKIQCKHDALINKYISIKEASKDNELLNDVLQEFVQYYKEQIEENKRTELALVRLRDYLDELDSAHLLTNEKMEHVLYEKEQIFQKLTNIRKELERNRNIIR